MVTLIMIPWLWLCALCAFVQTRRLSLLRSHLLYFWWGNATLADPVHSVPRTMVVCWNPSGRLLGCLYSDSSGHIGSAFPPEVLRRRLSLVAAHQAFLWHDQSISAAPTSKEYTCFSSSLALGLLCRGSCLATWSAGVVSGSLSRNY